MDVVLSEHSTAMLSDKDPPPPAEVQAAGCRVPPPQRRLTADTSVGLISSTF